MLWTCEIQGSQHFHQKLQLVTKRVETICPKGAFWHFPDFTRGKYSFSSPIPSIKCCATVRATFRKQQTGTTTLGYMSSYKVDRKTRGELKSETYTCQLSRLRVVNFDLTPAHACGPISHAWLKNVSCCRLAWHNFQKYVNSDPCKERKPCVKWINDNTFLAISDFWSEKHWERACIYTRPKTGTR